MNVKKKIETIAVIDIGSNELRLKIAETGKNKLKYIDSLSYPLSLGRDTFDTGKISFEKVKKTCDIITNFQITCVSYGVKDIKAVATSAVREATNHDYILDQIKLKNDLEVEVVDDNDEKLYIYKLMMCLIPEKYKKSSLMMYIGSGNVGVSFLSDGKIPFMQNIKIGSLRVSELFTELIDYSSDYYLVLEEYLEGYTKNLAGFMPKNTQQIIASGHEVAVIAELSKAKSDGIFYYITREKFNNIYNEIKHKTVDRISADYNIPTEKAEVILPSMVVINQLWKNSSANEIICPVISLLDSIIFEKLFPQEFNKINKDFNKNILLSARTYAKHYKADIGHYENVENYALKIFDKMKKIHGMGAREKVLLQTATIFHDFGKFVNIKKHSIYSYELVMASDIVGLNSIEKEIIGAICLYHDKHTPSLSDEKYAKHSPKNRVLISKLTAILRLANSLDSGSVKKFDDIEVKVKDDVLVIIILTDKNIDLEQWFFNQTTKFFEEVFGMKAKLRKRRSV